MPLARLKVRSDLEYFDQEVEGETVIVVRDPVRGTYFKYNPLQAAMLRSLDGVRSLDEMVAALSEEFDVEIPRIAAERFVAHARKMLLLDVASYGVPEDKAARLVMRALDRQGFRMRDLPRDEAALAGAMSAEAALFAGGLRHLQSGHPIKALDYFSAVLELNPNNQRAQTLVTVIQTEYVKALAGATSDFPTFFRFNPTRLLAFLDRTIGRLVFHWMALVVMLGLAVVAGYCYAITPYPDLDVGVISIILAVVLANLHSFLHELGHGLACYHYGGSVPEIGFTLFYYLRPLPYCDTSSSYLFKNRNHKLGVQIAGTLVSVPFVSLMFVLLAVIHPGLIVYQPLLLILWLLVITSFANLIPFVKLDGYYALCDYWGVPNLRERSLKLLKGWLGARLLGLPTTEEPLTPGKRRMFFGFAVLSSLFTVLWVYWAVFRLLAPLVERFRGIGLLISVVVLGNLLRGMLLGPVIALVRLVIRERRRVFTLRRGVMLFALAAVVVGPWMIRLPVMVDAEFVLVPKQRVDLRAQTGGLVEQVLVREGDRVHAGQALAILRNDELEQELHVLTAKLAEADAGLAALRSGARPEEVMLASRGVGVAQATQSRQLKRATMAGALARTGLGTGAAASAAAGSAEVSLSLARAARWELATLEAGARPEDIAAAEAGRAQLATQLDHARAERARLTIHSPIDGVVVTKQLEELRLVRLERGDRFAEVHDVSSFTAEIRLPAGAPLAELATGDDVALRPTGAPGEAIDCAIARMRDAAVAASASRSIVQAVLGTAPGDLVAVTTPFATPAGRSGMMGHARLYGRRRSLAYSELYLPLQRVFQVKLWSLM